MALIEHLEKLRHFNKLAQHRSIHEAAATMGVSQAGLSKSISALEAVLETQLFIRSRQGLSLTKEGHLVLQATRAILTEAADVEMKLRSLRASLIPKTLRIGMYDSIAVYFFGELISYLNTIYKDLKINLTVDSSTRLANWIGSGELDLVIGVNLEKKKKHDEFFLLFKDDYSFYVSGKQSSGVTNLPLIIHPLATDELGRTVEDHLKGHLPKAGVHRVFNFETIKTLTVQGIGIGVLPTEVAKPLVRQGHLIGIQPPRMRSVFGRHQIGFLASRNLMISYKEFVRDLYRLGDRWAKS